MATLLKATGDVVDVTPANGRSFTLAELHAFVGGYIEIVRAPDDPRLPRRFLFFVLNEDGHRLGLALNSLATIGYQLTGADDVIVGDVVMCTRAELGEDET